TLVADTNAHRMQELDAGQTYHTATNGGGTQLNPGDVITTTQTIFVFAQSGTTPNCTSEGDFTVTINNTPPVPTLPDVVVCDSYVLPALAAGQTYHTANNGGGTQLNAGDAI